VLNVSSAQSDGEDAPEDPLRLNPHLKVVIKNEVESGDPSGSEKWAAPRMPNEEDDSVIRIAKRRLANKQHEIIPPQPQPSLPTIKPFRVRCWETISKWTRDAWKKVVSWANVLDKVLHELS
jgi:hypothetical protein